MSIERGNVFHARFPHASGSRGKRRPVVVVQSNEYNQRLRTRSWCNSRLTWLTKMIPRVFALKPTVRWDEGRDSRRTVSLPAIFYP
jgi:mRNA-degrading endonuclease toxin of MazEF toxin-antitoxin module